MLSKIRKAARTLLTLDLKDPKRLFETPPLIRRLKRYGLMTDDENSLDDPEIDDTEIHGAKT